LLRRPRRRRRRPQGRSRQALVAPPLPLDRSRQVVPRRRLLRALPGQGPGRARRSHPPRARPRRRHRAPRQARRRRVTVSSHAAEQMYFTWPDRRLRYECRGCGACCKGHGIGIDVAGGQLVQLLTRRPGLTAFLRRRGDAITAFNPRDRCWFLADDGLCRIEVEDGRAAKPASCRLFPFNRVFRLGGVTVVDYNSVICPLTVGDDGITHASIVDELASIKDPTIIATPLPVRDPDAEARAVIAERAIATAIFAAPGDLPTAWAAQAASPVADAPAHDGSAQADAIGLDRTRDVATAAFTALLGSPWRIPSAPTLAAATWLTPSLRFN